MGAKCPYWRVSVSNLPTFILSIICMCEVDLNSKRNQSTEIKSGRSCSQGNGDVQEFLQSIFIIWSDLCLNVCGVSKV